MKIALITGSAGLIGSEAVRFFSDKFDLLIGIDNNMRKYFFGQEGSVEWNIRGLQESLPNYQHNNLDIRDKESLQRLYEQYGKDIELVLHTAAQPSHDWAAKEPILLAAEYVYFILFPLILSHNLIASIIEQFESLPPPAL